MTNRIASRSVPLFETPELLPSSPVAAAADSPLNPTSRGNVTGASSVVAQIPGLVLTSSDLDRLRLETNAPAVRDPATVMVAASNDSATQAIKDLVASGSPHAAELIAAELGRRYGPFTAANTPEHRAAILDALSWIAGLGIQYDEPRAEHPVPSTYSPNETLSKASGVCRDIHTATAAILASLMNAAPDGTPGSPNGREGDVQAIGYNNPTEYHTFMVYRDPSTSKWSSLEYDRRYALEAGTAVDAMRQTTGSLTGITRYTLNGWNGKPFVDNEGVVNAARSNAFLSADAGVGKAGEVRVSGSASAIDATGFLTKNLSLSANVDPSALSNGLRGGVKLNYHRDFEDADTKGFLRVGGGVTTDFADSSIATGVRDASARATFQTWVLGFKLDGRLEGQERELIRNHLKVKWGLDVDALGGVPMVPGTATLVPPGAIVDYSKLNLGADGALAGHEQLSERLTLDWAVRARAQVDGINLATELITSGGQTASRSLLKDPLRAEVAMAFTHTSETGIVTRFEAGATILLAAPWDPESQAREVHHAVLTVSPASGAVNFALVAKGETLDAKLLPANAVGVAITLNPTSQVQFGVGASTTLGVQPTVQVMGTLTAHF